MIGHNRVLVRRDGRRWCRVRWRAAPGQSAVMLQSGEKSSEMDCAGEALTVAPSGTQLESPHEAQARCPRAEISGARRGDALAHDARAARGCSQPLVCRFLRRTVAVNGRTDPSRCAATPSITVTHTQPTPTAVVRVAARRNPGQVLGLTRSPAPSRPGRRIGQDLCPPLHGCDFATLTRGVGVGGVDHALRQGVVPCDTISPKQDACLYGGIIKASFVCLNRATRPADSSSESRRFKAALLLCLSEQSPPHGCSTRGRPARRPWVTWFWGEK